MIVSRVALIEKDIPFCLIGSVILCKLKSDYAVEFLYYALNAYYPQTSLWFTSASIAQLSIYIRDVAELRLPILPSYERENTVRHLQESLGDIRDSGDRIRLTADVVTDDLDAVPEGAEK